MAGNANSGRRDKPFFQALLMEIKEAGADNRLLRSIARKLLDKAEDGDMQAMTALMDRLDGKPMQQVEHSGAISTPSTMTDADLAAIIESGSGDRATETTPSKGQLN